MLKHVTKHDMVQISWVLWYCNISRFVAVVTCFNISSISCLINKKNFSRQSRATEKYIVVAIVLQYNYCNTIVRVECHINSIAKKKIAPVPTSEMQMASRQALHALCLYADECASMLRMHRPEVVENFLLSSSSSSTPTDESG